MRLTEPENDLGHGCDEEPSDSPLTTLTCDFVVVRPRDSNPEPAD
jgi:hypothetical protein